MERMGPLDASFLYFEDGITHTHIGSAAIFEGPPPAYEEVLDLVASKLPLVPRYRQRVRFVPFDLGRPMWVDDPHFSIEYHVRHTALPAPGGEEQLRRLVGRVMGQELDRDRPLWEMWVVEGLGEDRWALVCKVHHCMVDGVAGVDLLTVVLDLDREPQPVEPVSWSPRPEPTTWKLVSDAITDLVLSPREQARALRRALRAPRDAWRRAATVAGGVKAFGGSFRATPPTSLEGPIGPHRRWTAARADLADIKAIKGAVGATVNDVVLAAIAGGFRELLLERGEDADHDVLRTLVPVSVRAEDAHGILDNRVSAILFDLPVHIADPMERLAAVQAEMGRLKLSHEPEAGEAFTALAGALPPALTARALRLGVRFVERTSQRTMNTITTNVPGPPFPLYLCGREMVEYLPFVPIGPGMRVAVAILSYNGHVAFGITGDYDGARDIDVLRDGIEATIAEMSTRTTPRRRPVHRARPARTRSRVSAA